MTWKVFRALRVVRVSRLSRVSLCLEMVRWRIESEFLMLTLGLLKNVMGIIVLTHFVACFFYGVSTASNGSISSWIRLVEAEGGEPPSTAAAYAWCFYWALMQFTGLGLNPLPSLENALEVLYSLAMMLFTFVIST